MVPRSSWKRVPDVQRPTASSPGSSAVPAVLIPIISHRIHGTGIFTYIWLILPVNVGKYTTHGCYGSGINFDSINWLMINFDAWRILMCCAKVNDFAGACYLAIGHSTWVGHLAQLPPNTSELFHCFPAAEWFRNPFTIGRSIAAHPLLDLTLALNGLNRLSETMLKYDGSSDHSPGCKLVSIFTSDVASSVERTLSVRPDVWRGSECRRDKRP